MSLRDKLIMWGAAVGAAILSALLTGWIGRPIVIPPPPIVDDKPPPKPPETQPPSTPPDSKPDTLAAICRIRTSVGGCSATVIGPRRTDGRYWMLTASHCIGRVGETVSVLMRDGRTFSATVVNFSRNPDYCWMVTDTNTATYPYALLADKSPDVGTKIWHAGFGVDRPSNREDGEVIGLPNQSGRIPMRLSVSSGDSGGGICVDSNGQVFSTVCCTVSDGRRQWTEGASTEHLRAGLSEKILLWDWKPNPIPHHELPKAVEKLPKIQPY